MRKYFLPFSATRCFWRSMDTPKSNRVILFAALLAILETITMFALPFITWMHWKDYKRNNGKYCHLMQIYKEY